MDGFSMTEKKRVVALGFFDGVHIGHAALMSRVLEIGADNDLIPSVLTFDAHPDSVISGNTVPLINSPEDRTDLIRREFGIDDIILLHFDKETSEIPWDRFIDQLIGEYGASHLVAGHDFRFGSGGKGNTGLLAKKCAESGIGCDVIPEVLYNGKVVSSTYIRELISEGDIELANRLLGHPHVLTDIVQYGNRLGRRLGAPTINLNVRENVINPAFGVYATIVILDDGSRHIGVTNVGVRPTVDNTGRVTAETHILNYRGDLYGQKIRTEFHKYLRPEVKFSDMDTLKTQIRQDCESAQRYFNEKRIMPHE